MEICGEYRRSYQWRGTLGAMFRMWRLTPEERSPIAQKGGKARAKSLSPKRRQEIAMIGGLVNAEKNDLVALAKHMRTCKEAKRLGLPAPVLRRGVQFTNE